MKANLQGQVTGISVARRIAADAAHGLPEAVVRLSVDSPRRHPRVEVAYLGISARERRVERSRTFDDGGVVVDFDATGRILGFEFLCRRTESAFGGLSRWARSLPTPQRTLVLSAAPTVQRAWDIVDAEGSSAPISSVRGERALERVRAAQSAYWRGI